MKNDFSAFMAANKIENEEVSYIASKRFKGADGKPIPWKFHPITAKENRDIIQSCTKKFIGATGKQETTTDMVKYQLALITACVTYPDLNDAGLQDAYHVIGAEALIETMLLPGELTDLFKAISQANGFENDMAEKIKEAKN